MPNQKQFRFDLTQDQKETILEQTGEQAETLELTVEQEEDSVEPRGFQMF